MNTTIDKDHACAFTGHRPEQLGFPEAEVIAWLCCMKTNESPCSPTC